MDLLENEHSSRAFLEFTLRTNMQIYKEKR